MNIADACLDMTINEIRKINQPKGKKMAKAQTKLNAWLTSLLKREGKKHEMSRGDAREFLGLIADDVYAERATAPFEKANLLNELGRQRAKKLRPSTLKEAKAFLAKPAPKKRKPVRKGGGR